MRIESIDDPTNALSSSVEPGDVLEGTYTFDPATPDAVGDSAIGRYNIASPGELVVAIGTFSFRAQRYGILIEDAPAGGGTDRYRAFILNDPQPVESPTGFGYMVDALDLVFEDGGGAALGDDRLPAPPPPLGAFDPHDANPSSRLFAVSFCPSTSLDQAGFCADQTTAMSGVVTRLPEPRARAGASVALLSLVGCGALHRGAADRRRRRRPRGEIRA